MPGQLKGSAICPRCFREIVASFRTMNAQGATYEYVHWNGKKRRAEGKCMEWVPSAEVEAYERDIYAPLHVAC